MASNWLVANRVWRAARCGVFLAALTVDAGALGNDGAPIDTSDFTLDFHEGPNIQSARLMGLAGSMAPMTPGVVGYSSNAATAALRPPWSVRWFDWEVDGSLTSPTAITQTDFDNNGDTTYTNSADLFLTLGFGFQAGAFGAGFQWDTTEYKLQSLQPNAGGAELTASVSRTNVVVAHMFFDGQLAVGGGVGLYAIEFQLAPDQSAPSEEAAPVATVDGGTVQLGGIWAPTNIPLRAGLSARFASVQDNAVPRNLEPDTEGNFVTSGYYLPRQLKPPTELRFALATQLFKPINPEWAVPRARLGDKQAEQRKRRAERRLAQRGRLLIAAGLKVTMPSENGVGLESFLRQVVERSGERTTFSPSLGLEGEPIHNWLVLRGGTYLEPTRFRNSEARLHGTAGFDVHLPIWWSVFGLLEDDTTFRLGGAVDTAPRYFSVGVSLGLWR